MTVVSLSLVCGMLLYLNATKRDTLSTKYLGDLPGYGWPFVAFQIGANDQFKISIVEFGTDVFVCGSVLILLLAAFEKPFRKWAWLLFIFGFPIYLLIAWLALSKFRMVG